MLLTRHQDAVKNHDIKIAYRSPEDAAQLKHLRTSVTNHNLIHE
jgi:hypothetical protein